MGANDKLAAALHPNATYECTWCGREHATFEASSRCCGAWLDTLD